MQKEQEKSLSKRASVLQREVIIRIVVLLTKNQKSNSCKNSQKELCYSHIVSIGNTIPTEY